MHKKEHLQQEDPRQPGYHPPRKDEQTLIRLAYEAHILAVMYGKHEELKREIADAFTEGEKRDIKNPQGLKMASVSKTSPNKKAVCHDRAALLATAHERGMELTDWLPEEGTPEYVRAIDVLAEHAPELLPPPTISKEDEEEIANEVLHNWQVTGKLPHGWEVKNSSTPKFQLRKETSDQVKSAIQILVGNVEETLALPSTTTTDSEESK